MPIYRYQGRRDVYYELYGREGDPVVTICNGLSMQTSHWAPYFELLPQQGVRVLSYDMLGQGASSKPVLGVDFDEHARILHALHEHLGIERPYVMGISFGGVVVLKYAYMFPERIGGLVPVSTFSELDPQLLQHSRNLYIGMARVGFDYFLDLLMPLNFTNRWLAKHEHMFEVMKRMGVAMNELYGIQNLMESLSHFESITPELQRIACPTLIMNGEFDVLTPRHLHDILRRNIPNSRLMIVQNMCHAFTLEIPVITSRILADFAHSVERGEWRGDQSVWIASDDPKAKEVAFPFPEGADFLRNLPMDDKGQPLQTEPPRTTRSVSATSRRTRKAAGPSKRATARQAKQPSKSSK